MAYQVTSAKNKSVLLTGGALNLNFELAADEPDIKKFVWEVCISSVSVQFQEAPRENVFLGIRLNYVDKSRYIACMPIFPNQSMQTMHFHPIWYEFDYVTDIASVTLTNLSSGATYSEGNFFVHLVYHRKS